MNKTLGAQKKEASIGTFYFILFDQQEELSTTVDIWNPILQGKQLKRNYLCKYSKKIIKKLKALALEIAALERIKAHEPTLQNDPVARRELKC